MSAEILEDYDWESVDSEDWESDEAFAEDYDSVEDIGERSRRRRQRGRPLHQYGRGVSRIALRGPDGRVNNTRLPTPLATTAETNRGLAGLGARLNRLETRSQALQNKDGSVSGLVTLTIGGGLAGYGLMQAKVNPGESRLQKWVEQDSTKAAALVSATQLATSGAKLVTSGRYHRSRIGVAADIYAAAQLGAFAFGSLRVPAERPIGAATKIKAEEIKGGVSIGSVFVTQDDGLAYRVVQGAGDTRLLVRVTNLELA